jgi:hypothetical protein
MHIIVSIQAALAVLNCQGFFAPALPYPNLPLPWRPAL